MLLVPLSTSEEEAAFARELTLPTVAPHEVVAICATLGIPPPPWAPAHREPWTPGFSLDSPFKVVAQPEGPRDTFEPDKQQGGSKKCNDDTSRRLAEAVAPLAQAEWEADARARLACWWLGLPLPTQNGLGSCASALALHIGGRLDAAWRAVAGTALGANAPEATAKSAAVGGGECEWLSDASTALPSFPEFPAFPEASEFRLPPIPRLVPPQWQQSEAAGQSYEAAFIPYEIGYMEAPKAEATPTRPRPDPYPTLPQPYPTPTPRLPHP